MTWMGRDIDLELSLAAWRHYDYNYPREFPEYLYVSMTGTSTIDTGQPRLKYAQSRLVPPLTLGKSKTTGELFCHRTSLTQEEWRKVPSYRLLEEGDALVRDWEGFWIRAGLVAIAVAYTILLLATTISCL